MTDVVYVFSGTGNSLQIANEMGQRLRCKVLDIVRNRRSVEDYDRIGLVFPVHYYQPPLPVRDFIESVGLEGKKVWAVMDYGTTPGDAMRKTYRLLQDAGADVLFCIGCQMPENYIMMFDPPSEEECERMRAEVPSFADDVFRMINRNVHHDPESKFSGHMISAFGSPMYNRWRTTAKFRVTDKCTSCGLCEEICPSQAIELDMDSGRPVWVSEKCFHCAGCINRCPAGAIEYGDKSAKRRRYVNPVLKD